MSRKFAGNLPEISWIFPGIFPEVFQIFSRKISGYFPEISRGFPGHFPHEKNWFRVSPSAMTTRSFCLNGQCFFNLGGPRGSFGGPGGDFGGPGDVFLAPVAVAACRYFYLF